MNKRKVLGRVLRQFRSNAKLTQEQVAEATKGLVEQPAVSKIEKGSQGIDDAQMLALARVFGVEVSEIWQAVEHHYDLPDSAPIRLPEIPVGTKPVPLIGWVQAGKWTENEEPFAPGQYEKIVFTSARVGKRAFALRVVGDSMTNPREDRRSFPEGTEIIVDPRRQAENGALVIAALDDTPEATFKRLVVEGGRQFLVPLNPQYPTLPVDRPMRICGVVVAVAEKILSD